MKSAAYADRMTEAAWQTRVTGYCDLLGLRWHHEVDSRKSKSGFPDLVIVGPCGVIFAELKTNGGRIAPEQRAWLDDLHAAKVHAYVWRPVDWPQVKAILDRLAGRQP